MPVAELQRIADDHGIDALGVAAADVFESTRADLHKRKAEGLHASMQFTYRNPDKATDPTRSLPDARTLVVAARSYLRSTDDLDPVDGPAGAVARYVWEDHYTALRVGLDAIAAHLIQSGHRARVLMDDNALVDREAAYRAGLGWYGKNANLLLPDRGSWFVLGSVVTTADLPVSDPQPDGCGPCTRCLTSCPTDAIVEPGVIDANRCLAWLVQAEGQFPAEHRVALGGRIYGCDDCQEVCPPNRREARVELLPGDATQRPQVALLALLELDDDALMASYGRWYIPRRDPRYLRRNAVIALANVGDPGDPAVRSAVAALVRGNDDMLRSHGVWAAKRLGYHELVAEVADTDPSPLVQVEIDRAVPLR